MMIRVVRVLEQLNNEKKSTFVEVATNSSGPKFISAQLLDWYDKYNTDIAKFKPAKP